MSTNQLFAFFWACVAVVLMSIAGAVSIAFIQSESAHKPYSTTVDGKTVVCAWSSDSKSRTEGWTCK
ncbi:hypothetical protein SEA_WEASELS2_226 [Rhodococcus phage Weasels2]|uniref:Uncharacterized protein n=1 Tax=Rhodococcus phage Weasels2 TaxID=1897437 RepID=A0A1I9SAJ8_9CAUD|nr:hypothetical protein FDH04_gp190 [Rhodococcus phage Weasels2]AOZ63804.1 hypothetical protein SEA_WEASELS2_226 [Rhodococcus phage Weasels2]